MKRFVVETMTNGKVQTRLVPAKSEVEARRNCNTKDSSVLNCVPYTGQKIRVSAQGEAWERRLFSGSLAANRRRKGAGTWQRQ